MREKSLEKIKAYYNDNQIFYRVFWMNKKNLAMHYGYWYEGTKNKSEALLNENKLVSEKLNINKHDKVLDEGCGVGGTAIWIAENTGAHVTGITIVKKQAELARKYAKSRNINDKVSFVEGDFCKTIFPDNTFDKVYAIEAACHSEDKSDFLAEAYRILKPGGKICIADYFLVEMPNGFKDKYIYETVCSGWAMPNLTPKKEFEKILDDNNFEQITYQDNTDAIMKSAKIMSASAAAWLPIDEVLHFFKLISDENVVSTKASIYQYDLFKRGVAEHGLFCAEKPM